MYFDLRGGALGCGASQVSASQSMIVRNKFHKNRKTYSKHRRSARAWWCITVQKHKQIDARSMIS